MSAAPASQERGPSIELLSLAMIEEDPNQPRRVFLEDAIEELALNIETTAGKSVRPWIDGLLHPVTAYQNPGWAEGGNGPRYRLLTGARRLRAYRLRGWPVIPTRVANQPESPFRVLLIQINENLGRQDTSLWEDALAIEQAFELWRFETPEGTAQQFADVLGRSPTWISQRRMLARATGAAKQALIERRLTGVDVYRPFVRLASALQVQVLERVRRTNEPITLALLRPLMPRDRGHETATPQDPRSPANDNVTPPSSGVEASPERAVSPPNSEWPRWISVSAEQARVLLVSLNFSIPEEPGELAAALEGALAKIAV